MMTEQEILQQMDDLQAKLDEIRAGIVAFPVDTSMSEIEKEKRHQEDLQRLRGLRLIDDDFSNLPETFVIFITENDVIGMGKPIYSIERRIDDTDELFDDDEHIIYVNGADKDASTELGKLMHDFFCIDPDDMHYRELADKVRYFKEDEKGVAAMCKVMEDMRIENTKQVMEKNILSIMKNLKLTVEQAMDALSVPQAQREMYAGLVGKKLQ